MGGERRWDPAPLGDLVRRFVDERDWKGGLAAGRLRREWARAVGEDLARRSEPVRLSDGVLLVRAEGAWATELALMARSLAQRVDAYLGGGLVREVKVVAGPVRPPSADPPDASSGGQTDR